VNGLQLVALRGHGGRKAAAWWADVDRFQDLYITVDGRRRFGTVPAMEPVLEPLGTTRAPRAIAYIRVSTKEQGRSGLGLQAQERACRQWARANGYDLAEVISEVDSGDHDERPELARAIERASRLQAPLVVAKLDRLSRRVSTIANTVRSGIKVRLADAPDASTFEIHLRAALAEQEREMIAARTREALAAAKRKGAKLGSARPGHWKGREDKREAGRLKATATRSKRAASKRAMVVAEAAPILKATKGQTLRAIAQALEAAGVATTTGKPHWTPTGVKRLLEAV
jgi:DNA invertase Pin-like site-specific DNA recombinase